MERRWFNVVGKLEYLSKEELRAKMGHQHEVELEEVWSIGVDNYTCLSCRDCEREGIERLPQ